MFNGSFKSLVFPTLLIADCFQFLLFQYLGLLTLVYNAFVYGLAIGYREDDKTCEYLNILVA